MVKKTKLEKRVRALANDISMEEFKTFLDQNGFSLRKSSAGGSHRVYQIPISGIRKNVTITCPHGSKNGIPEYQIKLVLALIDEKKEELK